MDEIEARIRIIEARLALLVRQHEILSRVDTIIEERKNRFILLNFPSWCEKNKVEPTEENKEAYHQYVKDTIRPPTKN